jgi:hypothetical protein
MEAITMRRPAIPTAIQMELLIKCSRRCCLCFGLEADAEVKEGQIAHLDHNATNNSLENLAWLCLLHHDQYDSVHRQAKGITINEVKKYRSQLYGRLAVRKLQDNDHEYPRPSRIESDEVLELLDRYSFPNETTIEAIVAEILVRVDLIHQFTLLDEEVTHAFECRGIKDDRGDAHCVELEKLVQQRLKYPIALEVLQTARHLWPSWKAEVEATVKEWVSGSMSDEGYEGALQIFEEGYELDLTFILFGFREHDLSPAQLRALCRFTGEYGQREYVRQLRREPGSVPF